MRILGFQFNKVSGPDATRTYKIEFTVDESQASGLKDFFDVKKGTEFIAVLYQSNVDNIDELADESEEQTRQRYMKRIYAQMHDLESLKPKIEIKKKLKKYLTQKKYIKKSLSELDIKGLAAAIYYLENEFFND